MALVTGKATFIQFKAVVPSKDYLPGINREMEPDFILDRIPTFSFQDIDDTYDEYSIGWVSIADMLDAGFDTVQPLFGGRFIVMSMRIDERKIIQAILDKLIAKAERAEKQLKQIPKLSRSMKLQIKERIRTELLRKATPTPNIVNVYFDTMSMTGLFFSANQKAFTVFEDLFKETFGLIVMQEIPFTVGRIMDVGTELNNIFPHVSSDHADLVDIIEETRIIGQEFLVWLWWISEKKGSVHTENCGNVLITVGNNITLQSDNDKIACSGPQSDLIEAKAGVYSGKQVDQIGFLIVFEDQQFTGTVNSLFEFKTVAAPKIADAENNDDMGGLVLARAQQFNDLISAFYALFYEFLKERTVDETWFTDRSEITDWAGETTPAQ